LVTDFTYPSSSAADNDQAQRSDVHGEQTAADFTCHPTGSRNVTQQEKPEEINHCHEKKGRIRRRCGWQPRMDWSRKNCGQEKIYRTEPEA
jgi:hypothetical protein